MSSRRRGLTLPEVVAAMVIVAVLSAVVIPAIFQRMREARRDAIIQELRSLETGIRLFQRDVGRYPKHLFFLTALPDTGVRDACDAPISARNQAAYRGPYVNRPIALANFTGGNTRYVMATGDSVESLLTRTTIPTPLSGSQQVIQILLHGPPAAMIELVDQEVDGAVDGSSGTVRHTGASPIRWTIPIPNGAC